MTHEQHCELRTCELAKQAGFDWETHYVYETDQKKIEIFGNGLVPYQGQAEEQLSAPTQAVLQRWIREVKNIYLIVGAIEKSGIPKEKWVWEYAIDFDRSEESFPTYEAALEAGLQKCLTKILEKK